MKKENGFLRDLWKNSKTGVALFLGSIFFIGYSIIAVNYEIGRGWNGYPSFQAVFLDISRFIPVAGAAVAALILFIDIIIFLCGLLVDWRKKRFQEAVEKAVQEAREKGYAEGYIDGQEDKDSGES